MELSEEYKIKLRQFRKAVDGFTVSLALDLFSFSEDVSESIKSGQVQKFEISCELMWKICKMFINEKYGIVATSPKSVYRGMVQVGVISAEDGEYLIRMLDDRNALSHIYNEDIFAEVHKKLQPHLEKIKSILQKIN